MLRVKIRGWLRRLPAAWFRFLCVAAGLTLLWALTAGLAPARGFTRSFYWFPNGLPGGTAFRLALDGAAPVVAEGVAGVDLRFLEENGLPEREYVVRWEGVWFSPWPQRIEVHAGGDDGVIVRVDGETVAERHVGVGMHTTAHAVRLDAGAHRLEIEHWQRGGGRNLNVQWARHGGAPRALADGPVFAEAAGVRGYVGLAAAWLGWLVPAVWLGGALLRTGQVVRRRVSARTAQEVRDRLRAAALPALLAPSQVLLFGPWSMHATNRAEFLLPFGPLALEWLWPAVMVSGVLALIGLALTPTGFRRYLAVLCAAGVLLWVQGNLLVAEYGVLDGSALDLAAHAWRVPLEAALWIGVLAGALFLSRAVSGVAVTVSALLMTVQSAALLLPALAPAVRSGSQAVAGAEWRLPPERIYELSSGRNLIHIVLDMFPTHAFAAVRDADPAAIDRAWSGFTFFEDHLGAFPTTLASMPAMLSGVGYRNEMPIPAFRRRHPSIFQALADEGYRLRSLSADHRDHPGEIPGGTADVVRYSIPNPYGSYREYTANTSAQLLDLSLFRHAPHGLKEEIYRGGEWLLQARVPVNPGRQRPLRAFGDTAFLREFAARSRVGAEAPVYTYVHLIAPHPPIATDADCAYLHRPPPHWPRYLDQVRCAVATVESLFDRLRVLDLYDRSAIVVTSDHGFAVRPRNVPLPGAGPTPSTEPLDRIMLEATPVLLIKPPGAQGALRTSAAPSAITDLPATLLDLAGLPNTLERGTSALALDPQAPRRRVYAEHAWGRRNTHASQYFDVLHTFAVDGAARDPASWRYDRAFFEPSGDRAAQYRRHWRGVRPAEGEGGGNVYRTGEYAALFVRSDVSRVAFDLRREAGASARRVSVRIDGRTVDRLTLSDDGWRRVEYAVAARGGDASPFCVELSVSGADEPDDAGVLLRADFR